MYQVVIIQKIVQVISIKKRKNEQNKKYIQLYMKENETNVDTNTSVDSIVDSNLDNSVDNNIIDSYPGPGGIFCGMKHVNAARLEGWINESPSPNIGKRVPEPVQVPFVPFINYADLKNRDKN